MLLKLLLMTATLAPLVAAACTIPCPRPVRIAALSVLALAGTAMLMLDPLATALARVDGGLSASGCGG
ncbi:hypothetical protein [Cupriavidus consociatus]|uniref:hypothetical protein n=1 Tax=Cupriavidus consociatus TaxID=2821357 RepID=UPI001AEA11E6|nr:MULTISPECIES: hypothetical protein [unclassified Cupriavidus]MBP0625454.1 hypothetical protein [Cupriavidus sp. LEh25]MDK2662199.1 hypothetical protein [Cupriavidus sp. LEh21]